MKFTVHGFCGVFSVLSNTKKQEADRVKWQELNLGFSVLNLFEVQSWWAAGEIMQMVDGFCVKLK